MTHVINSDQVALDASMPRRTTNKTDRQELDLSPTRTGKYNSRRRNGLRKCERSGLEREVAPPNEDSCTFSPLSPRGWRERETRHLHPSASRSTRAAPASLTLAGLHPRSDPVATAMIAVKFFTPEPARAGETWADWCPNLCGSRVGGGWFCVNRAGLGGVWWWRWFPFRWLDDDLKQGMAAHRAATLRLSPIRCTS